jgi:hypothetical protein
LFKLFFEKKIISYEIPGKELTISGFEMAAREEASIWQISVNLFKSWNTREV